MLLIFFKMITVGLLLSVGVFVYKKGIITQTASKELSALIVVICNPIMIISSALQDQSPFTISQLFLALGVSFVIYFLLILFGFLAPKLLRAPSRDEPAYMMLSLFGNVGFLGIPLCLSILGTGSMLYVIAFNIAYSLFFYSFGVLVTARSAGKSIPLRLKSFVNFGSVACLISIGIYIFRPTLPSFCGETLNYISSATTFLAMVVLGVNLCSHPLKKVLGDVRIYLFLALRILIVPILFALVLRALFPNQPMLCAATVLLTAMPAGNSPIMLASQHGADTATLTSGVLTSTLLCLITIPIVSLFFPIY